MCSSRKQAFAHRTSGRAERELLRASRGFGKERQYLARDGGIVDRVAFVLPAQWQSTGGVAGKRRWLGPHLPLARTFCCEARLGINSRLLTPVPTQHHHRHSSTTPTANCILAALRASCRTRLHLLCSRHTMR